MVPSTLVENSKMIPDKKRLVIIIVILGERTSMMFPTIEIAKAMFRVSFLPKLSANGEKNKIPSVAPRKKIDLTHPIKTYLPQTNGPKSVAIDSV